MRIVYKFLLLIVITHFFTPSVINAQKRFWYPLPNSSVELDTLQFTRPLLGEKVLNVMNEVKQLQGKVVDRLDRQITFRNNVLEENLWTWGLKRISPRETRSLLTLAFKPIPFEDSTIIFLSFSCSARNRVGFKISEFNRTFKREFHTTGGKLLLFDEEAKGYALWGSNRDTVYLSESRGSLAVRDSDSADTIQTESANFIVHMPDSKVVTGEGLPQYSYAIAYQNFGDDGTIFEVIYNYIIIRDPVNLDE